jgi:hypothetical protein
MTIQERIDDAFRREKLSRNSATGEPTKGAWICKLEAAQLTRLLALVKAAAIVFDDVVPRSEGDCIYCYTSNHAHEPNCEWRVAQAALAELRKHGDIPADVPPTSSPGST